MAATKLTATEAAQWRAIGAYTSAQAACLLLDQPPGGDIPPAAVALAGRIRERFGVVDWSPNHKANRPTTIDHTQLADFATQAGITKALILNSPAGKLDPRRETTLLLVIAALARMANLPPERCKAAGVIVAQLEAMGAKRDQKAIVAALRDAEDAI